MARPVAFRERDDPKGGGIYCFYPFDSPLDEYCRGIFKIGLAIDFHSRIGNYHTYLPQGVYTSALLQNPTKKAIKNKRIYYGKFEKQIYKDVEDAGGKPLYMAFRKQNSGKTEWIYASEKMIDDAFLKAEKDFGGKAHLYKLRLPKKTHDVPIFTGTINYY